MKYKIIASLTTTPYRIDLIFPNIISILKQTIHIDSIEINIPYTFKRTGEEYIVPKWLMDLSKNTANDICPIRIFRTEDYGAATKVAPTLLRHKDSRDAYIWSVDDDFEYPHNMLAVLYREFNHNKKQVISHSSGRWNYKQTKASVNGYYSSRKEGLVDFFEGFATVLYPPAIIEDDFEGYMIKTSETWDCRNSDDIILSNYVASKDVNIYNCAYPYNTTRPLLNDKHSNYSETSDALHHQGGGNKDRYIRVYNWLVEQGINAWYKK
jgi:hypothetical protein